MTIYTNEITPTEIDERVLTQVEQRLRAMADQRTGFERLRYLGQSIFVKQLALYLLLILVLSSVTSFLFFFTARRDLETAVGEKIQSIARISARNAPFERLDLIRVGDDRSRMVLRLKEKLAEIQEVTGVSNIFVFGREMNSLLDLAKEVPIGSVYQLNHFDPELWSVLERGVSVNTGGYRSVAGEFFLSAYAPINDRDGQLFAVVGVDAGIEELDIIDQMRAQLYWITLAGIGLACALALVFARSITSPVRHIAQTAEELGRGNYEARAQVESKDEVAVLADAVNRMADQVRKRDSALKEMGASVAHEIRNPLNSIKLLVSLLDEELRDQKNTTQIQTIATLHYEIGKLNRFIEEFLTYARPVTAIGDRVSAAELVAGAADMASAEAAEKNVSVEIEVGQRLPLLEVDRLRLEQTLLNLLLNAVQACGDNGQVKMQVQLAQDGGVDFVVEDNGDGIEATDLPHLFDPFFTTKADGTGLGLANVRKIVEEHQGLIEAFNRSEGGARFVLHLPSERLCPEEG